MSITFRPARREDLPEAVAVRSVASFNFKQKYGFVGTKKEETITPDSFYSFAMDHESEGFWVAEEGDRIVGMMIFWERDAFRFLAYLFVAPHYQEKKVGSRLLDAAFRNTTPPGIANRALITYAYNLTSLGAYMKYGIFSRESLYKMAGNSVHIRQRSGERRAAEIVKIEGSQEMLGELDPIDETALGFSRRNHHAFFLQRKDGQGYLFRTGKDVLGYSYIWDDGQVGPLAALSEGAFDGILRASLSLAAEKHTEQVSFLTPGSNESAISLALQYGLRVHEPYILMAARPFGKWGQYLFHSPPLM